MRRCACANVSDFKYRDVKIFLVKISKYVKIRAIKFGLKIPIHYKDLNKTQTEFPSNGSGMRKGFVVKKVV